MLACLRQCVQILDFGSPVLGSRLSISTESQSNDAGEKPFFSQLDQGDNDNDNCLQPPEKKRRLTVDQVQFLERSFEVENKLEPDRKVQLANEIGLQPRQVAIWFQNRRARYKTKQLEKDYDCLKSSYDKLMNDYDVLFKENDKLKNEVHLLRGKLLAREKGTDLIGSLRDEQEKPIASDVSLDAHEIQVVKQEGASSSDSEVFDSDSIGGGNQSSFQEPDGFSNNNGAETSDFSQDEDDILRRSLLQPSCFPKLENVCCNEINGNNFIMGFPLEEDQATWFWPY